MDTLNPYVLKAIDAYPFELEETVENLNYALSYQSNDAVALFLMGRLYAEQLNDFEKAKHYFSEALASKLNFVLVYPHYISVLIWNEDYEDAQQLIDFAFKVKGLGKGQVYILQAYLHECLQSYKKSLKALRKAREFGYNDDFICYTKSEMARVKMKMKPRKKSKYKSKTTKKKKN